MLRSRARAEEGAFTAEGMHYAEGGVEAGKDEWFPR